VYRTGQVQEFCQADVFSAECPDNHVIIMKSAFYGRMKLGRCVRGDYGYLGCAKDDLDFMHAKCSGANSCRFRVFDSGLGRNSRCPADIASYLEASFYCHQGELWSCYVSSLCSDWYSCFHDPFFQSVHKEPLRSQDNRCFALIY